MIKKTLFVLLAMSLMMAACAPVVKTSEPMTDKPTEAMMDKPTEAMMENDPLGDDASRHDCNS